jgi:hypothetical protein
MRRTISAVAAVVAGAVLLTGCSALQEAADTVNAADRALTTAQVCAQAIGAIDFSVSTDPQTALEQTENAAGELSTLATQAGDATVADAISGVATTLSNVTLDDLVSPLEWVQDRTAAAADVLNACAGF